MPVACRAGGQVDGDAAGRVEILGIVAAQPTIQRVIAGAAVEPIGFCPAKDGVNEVRAGDALDARQAIVGAATIDDDAGGKLDEDTLGRLNITKGVEIDAILAAASRDCVIALQRIELVIAGISRQAVVEIGAPDGFEIADAVGAALTIRGNPGDEVHNHAGAGLGIVQLVSGAGTAIQRVIAATPGDTVIEVGAGDAVGPRGGAHGTNVYQRVGPAQAVIRGAGQQVDDHGGRPSAQVISEDGGAAAGWSGDGIIAAQP